MKTFRGRLRIGIWLGTLGVLGFMVPHEASARSVNFLETVGISTTVGAVLGASTLPFYEQPGSHLVNVAYGAGAGLAVGLGVWLYQVLNPSSDEVAFRPMFAPIHSDLNETAWLSSLSLDF